VEALATRIESSPPNAALTRRVDERLRRLRQDAGAATDQIRAALDRLELVPLRVPGLFYRSHAWTGADLARSEVWLGRPVALVETGEVDTVARNAAIVRSAVRDHARDGRRVVILSASKGSADVHEALASDPSLGSQVAIWIDLVGLLEGTPLTDPQRADAETAAAGLPADTALSMSHQARGAATAAAFPADVRAVHVAGFPTSAAISKEARAGYERLRPLGPNDGYLMLDSFVRAPGRVLVIPETDHYLRTADLEPRLVALISVLLDELAASRTQASAERAPPKRGAAGERRPALGRPAGAAGGAAQGAGQEGASPLPETSAPTIQAEGR
jgi:hypothetical protein